MVSIVRSQVRPRGEVNVVDDLHADPTGTVDAAAIIQSAFASNTKVIIPKGTYLMDSTPFSALANQALNPHCLRISGVENLVVDARGAEFIFGDSINDAAYLFLAVATSPAQASSGDYTKNITWLGGTITRSRTFSSSSFIGGINTHSAEDVLYDGIRIGGFVGDSSPLAASCFSGANNKGLTVQRCRMSGMSTGFDLSNCERLLIIGNEIIGGDDWSSYGVNYFFDPVTGVTAYDYTEDGLEYEIGSQVRIIGNRVSGCNNGIICTTSKDVVIANNVCIGRTLSNANIQSGIRVGTDSGTDGVSDVQENVVIRENACSAYVNSGSSGFGAGIIAGQTGASGYETSDVRLINNACFDNGPRGVWQGLGLIGVVKVSTAEAGTVYTSRDGEGNQTAGFFSGNGTSVGVGSTIANAKTANFTMAVPAGMVIRDIFVRETAGNAVTGGLKFGTSSGGTQVVTAFAVAGNSFAAVSASDISARLFSATSAQTLYVQAVTAWNSASVDVTVTLDRAII